MQVTKTVKSNRRKRCFFCLFAVNSQKMKKATNGTEDSVHPSNSATPVAENTAHRSDITLKSVTPIETAQIHPSRIRNFTDTSAFANLASSRLLHTKDNVP